ncbi:hypothetical protein [Clostridium baratii]|uniref:hypothetical protein n=1 Tax=Clostridium baratii TaxID=1561 RepID=UPI0030D2058D
MREVKIKNTLLGILVGTSLLLMSGCAEKGIESGKQHTKSSEERNMSDEEKEILEGRKQAYKDAGFTDEQITMLLMDEKEFAEFAMANPEKIKEDYKFYIDKYFDTMNIYYSGQYQEQQSDEEIESKIDWSKAPDFEQEYSEEKINGEFFLWGDYHKGWMLQRWNKMTPEERKQEWIESEKRRLSENLDRQQNNENLTKRIEDLSVMREKLQNEDITLISKEEVKEKVNTINEEFKNVLNLMITKLENKEKISIDNEVKNFNNTLLEISNKNYLLIGSNPFVDMHDDEYNLLKIEGDFSNVGINSSYCAVHLTDIDLVDDNNHNDDNDLCISSFNKAIEYENSIIENGSQEEITEEISRLKEIINFESLLDEKEFDQAVYARIDKRLEDLNK